MDDHPLRRAVTLIVITGLCFSTLDAMAKYLVRDHALLLVVWARYMGQMLVVTPVSWHRGGADFWRTKQVRLQLLRSLLLVAATLCFFGGLKFLPLAEASAIVFLAPMFAIVLAMPVLGERPTRARWTAAFVGFGGILLIVRPGSEVFHPAAALLLLAAITNALFQLLTRKLAGDSPHTTLFYSGLVGTIALTVLLPFTGMPAEVTALDALFLILMGLLAGFGHFCFIAAFQRAPASLLAPFAYVQMLWATIYGYLIFDQLPDHLSMLGIFVIVASGVGLVLHERRMRRPL